MVTKRQKKDKEDDKKSKEQDSIYDIDWIINEAESITQ